MGKLEYTNTERLRLFLHSFHDLSQRQYWPQLRNELRPDRLAELQFDFSKTSNQVMLRSYSLRQDYFDLVGPRVRQFLTGGDEVSVDKVLQSVRDLGIDQNTDQFEEAQHQWDQIIDRRFSFYVRGGETVGMLVTSGRPVQWDKDSALGLCGVEKAKVSLRDAVVVALYEGHIHPYEPERRDPDHRRLVRSIPETLRVPLANLGVAATAYAAMILHREIGLHLPQLACGSGCQEKRILDATARSERREH